ncbi:hypothetical protein MNBD_GAMMA03-1982 [hydrothermal vent metagenome]|uniref:SPOR domain-containing protein n=1 Tax=hydrothermal vent metagenome TaxID=652676 RepID=A0A3B0VWZ1_9ZZZZ
MDEVSKFRLTGAIIWLMLLVILVPFWFGEPVHFKPEGYAQPEKSAERPLVEQVYMLPKQTQQPKTSMVQEKKVIINKKITTSEQKESKGLWIVKIATYENIKEANDLLGRLDEKYDVTIKEFKKNGMYSVRVGPYSSKAKAEKNKQKLDKMLRLQSEVVQLP